MHVHKAQKVECLLDTQPFPHNPHDASALELLEMQRRVQMIDQLLIQTNKDKRGLQQDLTIELLHNERIRLVNLIDAHDVHTARQLPRDNQSISSGGHTERRYNSATAEVVRSPIGSARKTKLNLALPLQKLRGPSLDDYEETVDQIHGCSFKQQSSRIHMTSRIEPKPSWMSHREVSFLSRDVSKIYRRNSNSFGTDEEGGLYSDFEDSEDMDESVISNPVPSLTPNVHEFARPSFVIHEKASKSQPRSKPQKRDKPRKEKPQNPVIVQVAPYPYYPPPVQCYPNYPYQSPAYPAYGYPPSPHYPPQDYRPPRDHAPTKVDCATQYGPTRDMVPSLRPGRTTPPSLAIVKSAGTGTATNDESLRPIKPQVKTSSPRDHEANIEGSQGELSCKLTITPTHSREILPQSRRLAVSEVSQLQITATNPLVTPVLGVSLGASSKESTLSEEERGSMNSETEFPYCYADRTKNGYESISLQTSAEYPPPKSERKVEAPKTPFIEEPIVAARPKAWAMDISEEPREAQLSDAFALKRLQVMKKLKDRKVPTQTTRTKSPKTKEELIVLRKEMLKIHKSPILPKPDSEDLAPAKSQSALLQRLASGTKVKVSKQEMRRLANRFTAGDPIKAEREEQERRKEELKQRVATAKAYEEKSRQDRLKRLKKAEAE